MVEVGKESQKRPRFRTSHNELVGAAVIVAPNGRETNVFRPLSVSGAGSA